MLRSCDDIDRKQPPKLLPDGRVAVSGPGLRLFSMSAWKYKRALFWLSAMMLMVMGCSAEEPPTQPVLADCFAYFHLFAWHDLDGDGLHDETEPPLPGVEFTARGAFAYASDGGKATSDSNGTAVIDIWMPGECLGGIEIHASIPEAYQPSNDPILKIEELTSSTYTHEFGFMADGLPTIPAS